MLAHVEAHFPLSPVPTVPEIRLRLAGPRSGLARLAALSGDPAPPYWAHCWGGGLALARHLLDRPATVAGRSVLDLGCGSGLVAIAAMKAGARRAVAVDIDRIAVAVAGLNAAANGVGIEAICCDPLALPPPEVDIVLAGDVFYEAGLARAAAAFLDRCVAAGIDVLVGDPGRTFLPHARLKRVSEYPGPDFGRSGPVGRNAVFIFG